MSDFGKLTRGLVSLGIAMALTPGVFTLGPVVEKRYFPVVNRVEVSDVVPMDDRVAFHVRFLKRRQCEFISLAWYSGDMRMPIDFGPYASAGGSNGTRPSGWQHAGPWALLGVESLRGTRAFVLHRCHPLWITISEFYRD